MSEDRFPNKTDHNVLQDKREWADCTREVLGSFLNEFVPPFNSDCLLCARNYLEPGDAATYKQT